MSGHNIVSHEEWLAARKEHLRREKEFTRLRDQLSRERRELPWERVEKDYVFDGPNGRETLSDLFAGKSQLVVYHFMLGPDWSEGCKSCSFWADNFNGIDVHLKHRDVALIAVSRAPFNKLDAYKKRMGWSFKWVSSFGSDFNRDYRVSFMAEDKKDGKVDYNYTMQTFPSDEAPGISVFAKAPAGDIFHTYSSYGRGLDMLNGAYHYLDLVPKGRDEEGLAYHMEWLRHRDKYKD
ncbi:MAG TPA: thioredoxin family protein [Candidatus Binatia bacterium]|jgi:predicted dithiol-disulfide oxidoreductase (DUF899 family)